MSPDPRLALVLNDPATPRWLKEVNQFLSIKSQFLLHGNIRDFFPWPDDAGQSVSSYSMCTTHQYLVDFLALRGYEHFFLVRPQFGVTILASSYYPGDPKAALEATAQWVEHDVTTKGLRDGGDEYLRFGFKFDKSTGNWRADALFPAAVKFVDALVHSQSARCAVFFDYMMGMANGGKTDQRDEFVHSLILSHAASPRGGIYNTIFWLCDRENDLPAWFTLDNPRIRSIGLPKPDGRIRTLVGGALLQHNVPDFKQLSFDVASKVVDEFSRQTDGLLISDLDAIVHFIPAQGLKATEIGEAARRYKLGVTEDPWRKVSRSHLANTETLIRHRVKGQERAVQKVLDTLRKAIVGISGAHVGRVSSKPKGVLFFAGPTGVGKTELAKSITEGLFGDENAYIRFDMSEFNHEHADQRLIGAPPGYVGFEAGGELTQAIRQRPFSVVLFDEIEKAHPKILDKFLQILDDGQLTSGKGERVYFSDAIIIFTSNLGMSAVRPTDDYVRLDEKLRQGITEHFTSPLPKGLNRPELLNRIGDNLVIFDYIRPDIGVQILRKMVANVLARVRESQGIVLTLEGFSDDEIAPSGVFQVLVSRCTGDLSNGGRGIGNLIETSLLDPLSRAIWDQGLKSGDAAHISALRQEDGRVSLVLERR